MSYCACVHTGPARGAYIQTFFAIANCNIDTPVWEFKQQDVGIGQQNLNPTAHGVGHSWSVMVWFVHLREIVLIGWI